MKTTDQSLEARVRRLEGELAKERAAAETHRRRAELLEESARRAWALAGWGGKRTQEREVTDA